MRKYDPDNDPLWSTIDPSIDGYSKAIRQLLVERHQLRAACDMVLDAGTNDGEEKSAEVIVDLIDWEQLRTAVGVD